MGYRGCATAYKVCSSHYRYLRRCLTERESVMCKCKPSNETNTWKLIGNLEATNPVQYKTLLNMIDEDVSSHHWLCSECYCLLCHESFCDSLEDECNDPIVQCRNRIMKELITSITNDGIIFNTFYINKFKHSLSLIDNIDDHFDKYVTQFKRLIDSVLVKRKFSSYSNFPNPGVIYYDTSIFSSSSMPYIHQLLNRNAACCSTLKGWIKEQISLFPKNCCNFDYRKLVYNNEFNATEFNKYFHEEMKNFFLAATSSKRSKHRKADSPFLNLRRLLCIRMAISLLCLAMNPKAVFMQTLVGLIAYAYGLNDMGFDILNILGVTCSIDQVKKHGTIWSKMRNASEELMHGAANFWRASLDKL